MWPLISQTEWHTVVLWRGLAELAQKYLHKGSLVYIEGKIRYRQYDDKEGLKKQVTEILADQLIMLDKKPSATQQADNNDAAGDDPPPF